MFHEHRWRVRPHPPSILPSLPPCCLKGGRGTGERWVHQGANPYPLLLHLLHGNPTLSTTTNCTGKLLEIQDLAYPDDFRRHGNRSAYRLAGSRFRRRFAPAQYDFHPPDKKPDRSAHLLHARRRHCRPWGSEAGRKDGSEGADILRSHHDACIAWLALSR